MTIDELKAAYDKAVNDHNDAHLAEMEARQRTRQANEAMRAARLALALAEHHPLLGKNVERKVKTYSLPATRTQKGIVKQNLGERPLWVAKRFFEPGEAYVTSPSGRTSYRLTDDWQAVDA